MKDVKIAFCITGSFCTFKKILQPIKTLVELGASVQPIFSDIVYNTDTRFYKALDFRRDVEEICGKKVFCTIPEAEPIGPKNLFDITVVAPCTGNTLAKIAAGVTDTAPAMAVKATLRNANPVVLAVSTNDGLANNAKNIGALLNQRHIYFVPFGQDDPIEKPTSLVAHMELLPDTILSALKCEQIQPLLI